jgi:hypothetical protein
MVAEQMVDPVQIFIIFTRLFGQMGCPPFGQIQAEPITAKTSMTMFATKLC